MTDRLTRLQVSVPGAGDVSALLLAPPHARACFAFAHGAGTGMEHAFMDALAHRLAEHGVATLRYNFPYMERGGEEKGRGPDRQPVLLATVRAAAAAARDAMPGVPLVAGGKSMGGRMTTLAQAEQPLEHVSGIVLVGFPLHAAGTAPGTARATHLADVRVPMLFLQGTRDALADLALMRRVCEGLGARATLHVIEGGDHGFHVLKRSGRSDDEVLEDVAKATAHWIERVVAGPRSGIHAVPRPAPPREPEA